MILKSEVCDRSGRLLLPAGAELAEKQLRIFLTWGVTEADIELGPDETFTEEAMESSGVDPEIYAAAEQAVALLFRHNDHQHPMIMELMRVCIERRLSDVR